MLARIIWLCMRTLFRMRRNRGVQPQQEDQRAPAGGDNVEEGAPLVGEDQNGGGGNGGGGAVMGAIGGIIIEEV